MPTIVDINRSAVMQDADIPVIQNNYSKPKVIAAITVVAIAAIMSVAIMSVFTPMGALIGFAGISVLILSGAAYVSRIENKSQLSIKDLLLDGIIKKLQEKQLLPGQNENLKERGKAIVRWMRDQIIEGRKDVTRNKDRFVNYKLENPSKTLHVLGFSYDELFDILTYFQWVDSFCQDSLLQLSAE